MKSESTFKTVMVATVLCLVCSSVVSTLAVKLRPLQKENKRLDIEKNILSVTGLLPPGQQVEKERVEELFAQVESKMVTVKDGTQKRVYLVKGQEGQVKTVVLPVEGLGLWSTLYGFLALKQDLKTVEGIGFYEHKETPGLGGEVDNPSWKASWQGKKIIDEQGTPVLQVLKGSVDKNSDQAFRQIDGLSGATITGRGVEIFVNRWLGEEGFAPFLESLREEEQE